MSGRSSDARRSERMTTAYDSSGANGSATVKSRPTLSEPWRGRFEHGSTCSPASVSPVPGSWRFSARRSGTPCRFLSPLWALPGRGILRRPDFRNRGVLAVEVRPSPARGGEPALRPPASPPRKSGSGLVFAAGSSGINRHGVERTSLGTVVRGLPRVSLPSTVLGVGAMLLWWALASRPPATGCGNLSGCTPYGPVFNPLPYFLVAGAACAISGAAWLALAVRKLPRLAG